MIVRINFRQAGTGEVLDCVDVQEEPAALPLVLSKVLRSQLQSQWRPDVGDSITFDELTPP